jgi:hypothetical protein
MAENSAIDIFLRLRPVPRPSTRVIVNPTEAEVEFNIPKQAAAGYVLMGGGQNDCRCQLQAAATAELA